MEKKPLVSVVLNFFNAETFLREAIESVLAQTYDNWELLLVDDGSDDGSTDIAREYCEQYSRRIRYLEHKNHTNRGISASRNVGIAHAEGELIALLDADDAWFPQKLQEQVMYLHKYAEAAMVFGNRLYWYSWAENPPAADCVSVLGFPPDITISPPRLLIYTLVKGTAASPCPSDLMFRREMAERVAGFEETFEGMFEDQAFLAKVFLNEVVIGSDACWSKYRIRPDSTAFLARRSGQWETKWVFFLKWLEGYLSQRDREPQEVWRTVQSRLWRYRHPFLHAFTEQLKRAARVMLSRGNQQTT